MKKEIDYTSKKRLEKELKSTAKATNFIYPKSQHSVWDVSYTVNGSVEVAEIKQRRFNSTRYPDSFIEMSKYKGMLEQENPVFYAMFDDCYYKWDLTHTKPCRYHTMPVQHTTDFSDRTKIQKEMVYFSLKDGIRYEYSI